MSRLTVKARAIRTGLALGLPEDWLRALPEITPLPGAYAEPDLRADVFLAWKRQELLVRTGRLEEIDRALVADALEQAAADDGPRRVHNKLQQLMFCLTWPKRTAMLGTDLRMALDLLRACLKVSPSMRLFKQSILESAWQATRYEIIRLDDFEHQPSETCPWRSVRQVIAAAARRVRRGRQRLR